MATTSQSPQQQLQQLSPPPTLQVNFSWKKFESLVSEKGKEGEESKPLYIVDYHTLKLNPRLFFKSVADDSIIGTGTLHPISINADCEIRGRATELQALSRLKTKYMHLSHNFSDTDTPIPMTWVSDCNFKTWNFVCLDSNQMAVARFAANVWAVKKIGNIEFLGEKTRISEAAREEIVIMGITLYSCMALRMNNLFNLFGMIASPAKLDDHKAADASEIVVEGSKGTKGAVENHSETVTH